MRVGVRVGVNLSEARPCVASECEVDPGTTFSESPAPSGVQGDRGHRREASAGTDEGMKRRMCPRHSQERIINPGVRYLSASVWVGTASRVATENICRCCVDSWVCPPLTNPLASPSSVGGVVGACCRRRRPRPFRRSPDVVRAIPVLRIGPEGHRSGLSRRPTMERRRETGRSTPDSRARGRRRTRRRRTPAWSRRPDRGVPRR